MREKRGRDNEGERERADYSSGVNLFQSDQWLRRNNSIQLRTVDAQAALRRTPGKDPLTAKFNNVRSNKEAVKTTDLDLANKYSS